MCDYNRNGCMKTERRPKMNFVGLFECYTTENHSEIVLNFYLLNSLTRNEVHTNSPTYIFPGISLLPHMWFCVLDEEGERKR